MATAIASAKDMRIEVFTIWPQMVTQFLSHSLLQKSQQAGLIEIIVHDIRSATADPHRSVDDSPFGGGPGMVLMPEPVFESVESAQPVRPLYLLDPAGETYSQTTAKRLADSDGFSLLCGRYEGVDERIRTHLVDGEISLGDFVLGGGEVAAMAVIESVCRLVPGVLGNPESVKSESFEENLLDYPHYTRPNEFRNLTVPEVLRSGDHGEVAKWRLAQSLRRTLERRPDLIEKRGGLTSQERVLVEEFEESELA